LKILKKKPSTSKSLLTAKDSSYPTVAIVGASETGKSTIFRLLQQAYNKGSLPLSQEKRESYGKILFKQYRSFIKALVASHPWDSNCIRLRELVGSSELEPQNMATIGSLLSDGEFQKVMMEYFESRVNDMDHIIRNNMKFFLMNAAEILSRKDSFIKDEELLRLYVRTYEFEESELEGSTEDGTSSIHLVDFAGLTPERKRWPYGTTPKLILFCVSLTEYDQVLQEDETSSRLQESMDLFAEVLNAPWGIGVSFLCLFTKYDLLQSKVKVSPPNFPGCVGNSADEVAAYIVDKYQQLFHQITGGFAGRLKTIVVDSFSTQQLPRLISQILRARLPAAPATHAPSTTVTPSSATTTSSTSSTLTTTPNGGNTTPDTSRGSICSPFQARKSFSKDTMAQLLHRLVRLQGAKGNWEHTEELLTIMGVSSTALQTLVTMIKRVVLSSASSETLSIACTLVAIAFLEKAFNNEETRLVREKGTSYVKERINASSSLQALHRCAEDVLKAKYT